mgnify:CR=1 FL=1
MKQKPLEEIVQTLKQVYHGGYGLKEDSGNICAWYAEDGIHLAKGSSAIDSPRAQIVSWETVAERIGELLENGRFATNVELVEASGYERQKLAESLWHLYHDLSEEAVPATIWQFFIRNRFVVSLTKPQTWLKSWMTLVSTQPWYSSIRNLEKPLRKIPICFVFTITS